MKSRDPLLPVQLNWWEPTKAGEFGNLKEAERMYNEEIEKYDKISKLGKTDEKYLKHVIKDGTFNDKITLLSYSINESPLHNLSKFKDLLEMATKKSRDQAQRAMEALVTIFATQGSQRVLPERPLRVFRACLDIRPTTGQIIQAYFEDKLREVFFELLQCLETWLKDNVQNMKIRVLTFLFSLCAYTLEHSENIIRLVSNKLGDPDKKVATQAGYVLISLSKSKPLLKSSVIKALSSQLSKSEDLKCRAVVLNHLSQLKFSFKDDRKLFVGVFRLYVEVLDNLLGIETRKIVFQESQINKKIRIPAEGLEFKIIHFSLTGLKRVLPYIESTQDENQDISGDLKKYVSLLFLIHKHSISSLTCFQTLGLLVQLSNFKSINIDEKLNDCIIGFTRDIRIFSTKHLQLFLQVVVAFLHKKDVRVFKDIVKSLLQAAMHFNDSHAKILVLKCIHELAKNELDEFAKMVPAPQCTTITQEDLSKLNDSKMQLHLSLNESVDVDPSQYLYEIVAYLYDFDPQITHLAYQLSTLNRYNINELKTAEFSKSGPILFLDSFTNRKQKKSEGNFAKELSLKSKESVSLEELYMYEYLKNRKSNKTIKSQDSEEDEDKEDVELLLQNIELPSDMEDEFGMSEISSGSEDVDDPFEQMSETTQNDEEIESKKKKRSFPTFMDASEVEGLLKTAKTHKKKKTVDVSKF
eukprot:NODE_43_length_28809_cov_0.237200.p4 type:complete len:696 gc:universal NODE_43_length_28809_cov_0.237200:19409-21496(+)